MPDLSIVPKTELDRIRAADVGGDDRRAPRGRVPVERARRGQARGLGAPRLDVQRYGRRGVPPLRGAEHGGRRLGLAGSRRLLPRRRATTSLACTRRSAPLVSSPASVWRGSASSAASTAIRTSACRGSRRTRARSAWGSRRAAGSRGRSAISVEAVASWSCSATASCRRAELRGAASGGSENPWRLHGRGRPQRAAVGQADRRDRLGRRAGGEFRAFGWHVATCDGHSFDELRGTFASAAGRRRPSAGRSSRGRSRGGASRSWSTRSPSARGRHLPLARGRTRRRVLRACVRRDPSENRRADDRLRCGSALARAGRCGCDEKEPSLVGEPESGAGARRAKVTDEYVVDAYG